MAIHSTEKKTLESYKSEKIDGMFFKQKLLLYKTRYKMQRSTAEDVIVSIKTFKRKKHNYFRLTMKVVQVHEFASEALLRV